MIKQTIAEFAKLCGGRLVNADSGQFAQFVRSACEVDSRLITPGGVFFALGDGLQYVSDAFKNGAAVCVVDSQPEPECEAGPLILVDNTLQALARAASGLLAAVRRHREKEGLVFNVIGITGSCGKTTTKNILGYILSNESTTVVPRRSFNNEIGVPLTILQIDYNTQNLVLEMGASAVGDIAKLVQIAQPNIACVLNVGTSHIEGFGGIENTSKTKAELVVGVCEFARANRADGNASAQATAGFEARRLGDIGEMTPGTEEPRKEAGIALGVNSTRTTAGIVLGVDDLRVARMIELVPEGFSGSVCTFSMCAPVKGYGLEAGNCAFLAQNITFLHIYARDVESAQNGVEFTICFAILNSSDVNSGHPSEEISVRIRTQIPGEHSVYNYLAAIATAYCAGVSVERAATLAAQCTHFEPYRMQLTVLPAAYEPKVPSQQTASSPQTASSQQTAQNSQSPQTAQNSPNPQTSPPAQNPQTAPSQQTAQNLPLAQNPPPAQLSAEATAGDKMRDRAPLLHILNDAYNANQESCISALRTLVGLDCTGRRFAVFGAIAEQGSEVLKAYDSIAQVVVRLNIDHCVVVGKEARELYFAVVSQGSWDREAVFCKDLDEAFNFLKSSVLPGDCVLFKASNIFKLWELGDRFTQYMQQRLIRPENLEHPAQNLQATHPAPTLPSQQTSPETAQNLQSQQNLPNPQATHPPHPAPHQRGPEK